MLVIGERINATRKAVKEALSSRDAAFIRGEAAAQAEAGADYIDVNGGTSPAAERENMIWLVEEVQAAASLPLCLDSANAEVIEEGLKRHRNGRALVNSISMEKGRHESVLPLVKEHGAQVVALALDDSGIPRGADDRLRVVAKIVEEVERAGIALSDVFIDPLVMALSADQGAARLALEVVAGIKKRWPELKTTCGLSNISFGLPRRRLLNRTFLAMLMAFGLDSAIVDPLDEKLMAAVHAGRALCGLDEFCMGYIRAHRSGRLGPSSVK